MNIFRKIASFLTPAAQEPQCLYPPPLLRYQLRYSAIPEDALHDLRGQIKLRRLEGYHTQEIPMKAKMPPGCVGIVSCWHEGKLEYRRYLKLRVEHVEKSSLVYGRLVKRTLPEVSCVSLMSEYPCLPPLDSKLWFYI
ncbi:MAG: hypothetical protein LBD17_02330 [Endomicrobium sp.]|nr:hypothetical protein [Endomicrobium sp.]